MEKLYGKPIDIAKFKRPVLEDIQGHLDKISSIVDYLASNETQISQKACYVCKSSNVENLVEIHGFRYVTCLSCSHIFTDKRYSDDAIRRFYEKNVYWAEVTYANKETCFYRRDNVALPKVEYAEKHIGTGQGRLWLDVGAGIGDLVSVAKEREWNALGLELSETSVAFAKDVFGVELRRQTLEEYLAEQANDCGNASMVSMIGVLEHVVDPMGLLSQASRALMPGGAVMVQVPIGNSLASMVQSVFPQNVFRHMNPIEHIMLFTEPSLKQALETSGFELVSVWYHGLDIYELLTNLSLINERVQESPLFSSMMDMFNELQKVVDQKQLSDRIICVARKKAV
jgi:2-polyprenyl-3-methyl-5-hydroxy-6-metoxy-1,4-benzoquinol methylase